MVYSNLGIEPTQKTLDSRKMKRVLIADDNLYVRYVIRTYLKDAAEIEICGESVDGVQTLEMAKRLAPDLVLLDLSMPTLNGAEVALALKKTMPEVRIILFTMYGDKIGQAAMSTIGADAVLSKPDGMGHLLDCINGVFAALPSNRPPLNTA